MKNVKLQAAREKSGKTQARVAKEAGVTAVTYQLYEYGKRTPNVRTAIRIADALGVDDLREIFNEDCNMEEDEQTSERAFATEVVGSG